MSRNMEGSTISTNSSHCQAFNLDSYVLQSNLKVLQSLKKSSNAKNYSNESKFSTVVVPSLKIGEVRSSHIVTRVLISLLAM